MPILDWLNKEEAVHNAKTIPYRLLKPVKKLSYGDAGKVKCIFIDPPYNTKSAFEHYDDNLEHSKWLSTIYPRLELLRELLAEDGSIWTSIDDAEGQIPKFTNIENNVTCNSQYIYTEVNHAKKTTLSITRSSPTHYSTWQ